MPELPDVEHFRRKFARWAEGATVDQAVVDPTVLRNATPEALDRALRGRSFADPTRHGKWLVAWTDGPALLLHFGMTGDVLWSGEEPERHRHDRLILVLRGGGEIRYRNMRKLGGVWLAHDAGEVEAILGPLGPDALSVPVREFLKRLALRRGAVKPVLMDQTVVAGLGNILVDEVLWQARMHPQRPVHSLEEEDLRLLHATMRRVLRKSLDRHDYVARQRSWLAHVRGRPGAACPRCGGPLARGVVGGRTTYWCPRCQPAAPEAGRQRPDRIAS